MIRPAKTTTAFFVTAMLALVGLPCAVATSMTQEETTAQEEKTDPESDEKPQEPVRHTAQTALKPLTAFVGEWRGVGQVKRGSARGAWSEKVNARWQFNDESRSVLLESKGGKQFSQIEFGFDEATQKLTLTQRQGDTVRKYSANVPTDDDKSLVFLTAANDSGMTFRCTLQSLSDIRKTILFEKQATPTGSFRRIAGIGYTRSGSKLASSGGGKKCIVTGGTANIAVTYNGKTYYVCCTGCLEAFRDDPDGIIAAHEASLKETK